MGTIFFTLAPQMFALFNPKPEQQPIIEAGVPVLRLIAFAMPALASAMIFANALRGAGDTRVPVIFTWIGMFGVRIPLAYLLTRHGIVDLGLWGRGQDSAWGCSAPGWRWSWTCTFAVRFSCGVSPAAAGKKRGCNEERMKDEG